MSGRKPHDSSLYIPADDDRVIPATEAQIRSAQLTVVSYADRKQLPRAELVDLLAMLTGKPLT